MQSGFLAAHRRTVALLAIGLAMVATATLTACRSEPTSSTGESPATVRTGDNGAKQVTLSAQAAQRLGIQTAKVSSASVGGRTQKVVAYSALLYDPTGGTWVYTNPQPLIFERTPVVVDRVIADLAVVTGGPEVGTLVVTVGVIELYGVEVGVGK